MHVQSCCFAYYTFFLKFSLRSRRWIFKSQIWEEEYGLADVLTLLYGVR